VRHRDLARLRVARALHCAARMLKALIVACFVSACATADSEPPPPQSPPPIDPSGTYELRSELHLAAPLPGPAAALVSELRAATDGPDDPSRYLVDRMIAALPDGQAKTVAEDLAPFIAAYLDARLAAVAPRFLPGMHALSDQLASLAQQLDTIEAIRITPDHNAVRVLLGLHVGTADVMLATGGISEPAVAAKISFDRGALAIDEHRLELPYSRMLRLALDRGIIPAVDPGAYDLATLLRDLVDCPHLGQLVADALGIGPADLYGQACSIGMTAAASELYQHLDALDGTPIELVARGTARGVDLDRDGHMDGITAGIWSGTIGPDGMSVALGGSTFEGKRQ